MQWKREEEKTINFICDLLRNYRKVITYVHEHIWLKLSSKIVRFITKWPDKINGRFDLRMGIRNYAPGWIDLFKAFQGQKCAPEPISVPRKSHTEPIHAEMGAAILLGKKSRWTETKPNWHILICNLVLFEPSHYAYGTQHASHRNVRKSWINRTISDSGNVKRPLRRGGQW